MMSWNVVVGDAAAAAAVVVSGTAKKVWKFEV